MRTVAVILGVGFVLTAALTTLFGAFNLLFGWIPFLARVGPEVAPDWPSVGVGLVAVVLFALGVHWIGRGWRERWTARTTVAVVSVVLLLFIAGTSMVAMVHQVGWLATSKEPITVERPDIGSDSRTNLRQLALSLQNCESAYGKFPAGGTFTPDGAMLHGWATYVLPYIPIDNREIDLKQPWNAPTNRDHFKAVLPPFLNRDLEAAPFRDAEGFGLSHYAANPHVLTANQGISPEDITDGPGNTIMIGEVNTHFQPWGHPVNWRDPALGVNRSPRGFGGPPAAGGALLGMADGGVRFFSDDVEPEVLRAMGTPAGND